MDTATDVVHRPERQRFEIDLGAGALAHCDYRRRGGQVLFTHTEVPPGFQGRGIAARLVTAALKWARDEGLQAVPLCDYVASHLRRHPEQGAPPR